METRLKWVPRGLRAAPPGGGWVVPACHVAGRAASRLPRRAPPLAVLGRVGWRRSWGVWGGLVGSGPPHREPQSPPRRNGYPSSNRIPASANRVDSNRAANMRAQSLHHRTEGRGSNRCGHQRHRPNRLGAVGIGASSFVAHRVARGIPRAPHTEPTRLVAYELRHVMHYSAACQVASSPFAPPSRLHRGEVGWRRPARHRVGRLSRCRAVVELDGSRALARVETARTSSPSQDSRSISAAIVRWRS